MGYLKRRLMTKMLIIVIWPMGELGAVEADEEAQDWDELEEDGVAPRVAKYVSTPTAPEL